ncbi:putative 6-pyruvoyl tetrahydropterin synthase [Rickettsia amblyommatis str. Darkwater]|nr:putative 6-pyruvoyl tetrahydropterin synthase [Rickettsia amblyommatis str. Darkwater]
MLRQLLRNFPRNDVVPFLLFKKSKIIQRKEVYNNDKMYSSY